MTENKIDELKAGTKPRAQTRNWREQLLHVRGSSQEIGHFNFRVAIP